MHIAEAIYENIIEVGAEPVVLITNTLPPEHEGVLSFQDALRYYFMDSGKSAVGCIINTIGMSLTVLSQPGEGSGARDESVFEITGIPVLQGLQAYFSYDTWLDSLAGIDSMALCSSVYMTEFDGQLITFPIATKEKEETPYGTRLVTTPIKERMNKICTLARNWALLGMKEAQEKKVAVILHNIPPRNDMIGSAYGLDTPVSVFNMVSSLEESGVITDYKFEDGKDIIDRIINGLSNDERWLSEEEMLEKAVATVSAEQYQGWFDGFGENVKQKMVEDWGDPPGEFMAIGDEILVPGIINGNVFIGLQPTRALAEKAEEAYHSTDFVCPHQYIAYYKWIEHVFKADVIVHVGTHGTLEWLPGKEIGLSDQCYPDLAIGCMPHVYVYNVSVTGEGMQAKRRSYAALIGHMVPSMVDGGVYDELAEMDELITAYYHARQAVPKNMPVLYEQIWELAVKLNLHMDLKIEERPDNNPESMNDFVEALHLWISEIKTSEVRDGLHILGEVPKQERFSNLIKLMVRIRNGEVPSLREALCERAGLDSDDLIDNGKDIMPDGRTKRMLLEDIDEQGRSIFNELAKIDFDPLSFAEIAPSGKLYEVLKYACEFIAPNLRKVDNELVSWIKGTNGEFISPGPSGNPSRGNANIMPTGRNFYSIDPGAVPSRTAWIVGQGLAQQMLDRELKSTGQYPESVAIVVYAGDTMKTYGEDLAEVLYLLGIKPVWLGNTNRVIGLETIPVEELGRPRVDVTLRISGLFRDTFPNLIERIEDAVLLAAGLQEPHEMNYVRKHIDEEMMEMLANGEDRESAFERASARIFGCPPGGYGAGVDLLIESKKWNENADLGNIYIQWSGHAYGRKIHGAMYQDQLRVRLSKTTVTIKNDPSIEGDMLDSDDYFVYHGGLVAAVRTTSGNAPGSYVGNTADVSHIYSHDINEETARIMRARINNPKWLKGLKAHGYKGAQEISAMVDIVFGWDATADVVENWMNDEITKNFVLNKETHDWINEVNPWAMIAITERLLEAYQRGMWDASEEVLQQLRDIYIDAEGLMDRAIEPAK